MIRTDNLIALLILTAVTCTHAEFSMTEIDIACVNSPRTASIVNRSAIVMGANYPVYQGPDYSNNTLFGCQMSAQMQSLIGIGTSNPESLSILAKSKAVGVDPPEYFSSFYESAKGIVPLPRSLDIDDEDFGAQRLSIRGFGMVSVDDVDTATGSNLALDDDVISKICGCNHDLDSIIGSKRLYVIDLQDIAHLSTRDGKSSKYIEPVVGYFCYNSESGKFLPLSILLGSSSLTYTPFDAVADWTMAKIALNIAENNDQQAVHFAVTHALNTPMKAAAHMHMSRSHPVRAIIDYHTPNEYAIETVALTSIFSAGTRFDNVSGLGGDGGIKYLERYYQNTPNIMLSATEDIALRGVDNIPTHRYARYVAMYEAAYLPFMESYVESFYKSDEDVASDTELSSWVKECDSVRHLTGFPTIVSSRRALKTLLVNFAVRNTARHQAMNGQVTWDTLSMPYSGLGLWKELPNSRGDQSLGADMMSYLMPPELFPSFIYSAESFQRPRRVGDTMMRVYQQEPFKSNLSVAKAVIALQVEMKSITRRITDEEANERHPYVVLLPTTVPSNSWT